MMLKYVPQNCHAASLQLMRQCISKAVIIRNYTSPWNTGTSVSIKDRMTSSNEAARNDKLKSSQLRMKSMMKCIAEGCKIKANKSMNTDNVTIWLKRIMSRVRTILLEVIQAAVTKETTEGKNLHRELCISYFKSRDRNVQHFVDWVVGLAQGGDIFMHCRRRCLQC